MLLATCAVSSCTAYAMTAVVRAMTAVFSAWRSGQGMQSMPQYLPGDRMSIEYLPLVS